MGAVGKIQGLRVALVACLAVVIWPLVVIGVGGELVLLVTLTRHGSRAPNTVIDEICPADKGNRAKYNVPPGQLTENGMRQAFKLGQFLREKYVDTMEFLPPTLGSGSERKFCSRFMSDPAERCLQTAQAMAMGLFPNGTGPPGFPNQPVAVETQQKEFANLLAAAHAACSSQQKEDNAAYDSTRGKSLIEENENITDAIAKACGTPTEDYANANNGHEGLVLGVKDVADMLDFDEQQGLPRMESISKKTHEEMTQLAFTLLQERYYSNRRQVTYWAGDFPPTLLAELKAAAKKHRKGKKPKQLYLGYHGHRELLYGVAHLLGWNFKVEGAPTALGTSSIPPATTMIFELHYSPHEINGNSQEGLYDVDAQDEETSIEEDTDASSFVSSGGSDLAEGGKGGDYYVRTYTWTPDFGQQDVILDVCNTAGADEGCRLSTIEQAVLASMDQTGSWQDICQHVPFDEAEEIAQELAFGAPDDVMPDFSASDSYNQFVNLMISVGVVTAVSVLGVVARWGAVAVRTRWRTVPARGGEYEIVP